MQLRPGKSNHVFCPTIKPEVPTNHSLLIKICIYIIMAKTRRAGFKRKRSRRGKKKSKRSGGRRRSRRGGSNWLLKNSLLQLVNSSSFDNFEKFAKSKGDTVNKEDIIKSINNANDKNLNESLSKVLEKLCSKKGGAVERTEHEFRIDSPLFNPSNLFSCILWAVILMHTDRIVLLGIWLGMCTGAGGIRF